MILATTTDVILESPVISVILGGFGTVSLTIVLGIARVLSKIQLMQRDVVDLARAVHKLEVDMDVIKWGAVASARLVASSAPPEYGEQP